MNAVSHQLGNLFVKVFSLLPPNFFLFIFSFIYLFTLQYCIGFAIHLHESAMGVHVAPIQ